MLWSRILVAGNIPSTTEAGTSIADRVPLLLTSFAASVVTMVARSTAEVRDIRTEKLCQMLCRCNRRDNNTVAPSSDDNVDGQNAAKARKDRINFEADIVGYGLIVLDIMIDWAAMMAFSVLIMVIEIHLLDVNAGEAFVSAVINYLVQFIPDLVFSVVYLHFTLLDYRTLQNRIIEMLPSMSYWWIFNVILFAGPVIRLGVSGLTLGVLGEPLRAST